MRQTPDPIPRNYLRSVILRGGLTQAEAAEILHVSPQTVRRWLTDGASRRAAPWASVELLRRMVDGA